MRLVSRDLSMNNNTKDYVAVGDWLNQPRGEWDSQKDSASSASTFHIFAMSDQLTSGNDSIHRLYDAIVDLLRRIG